MDLSDPNYANPNSQSKKYSAHPTNLELIVADQIKVGGGGGVVLEGGVQVGRLVGALRRHFRRGELRAVVVGLDVAAVVQVSFDLTAAEDFFA